MPLTISISTPENGATIPLDNGNFKVSGLIDPPPPPLPNMLGFLNCNGDVRPGTLQAVADASYHWTFLFSGVNLEGTKVHITVGAVAADDVPPAIHTIQGTIGPFAAKAKA